MLERENDFWNIWSTDYIRNLPAAYQKFRKHGNVKVGSVVLIREDNMPRMKWLLGVVQNIHVGRDGIPRAADVKTNSGLKTRAIQRLHDLELSSNDVDSDALDGVDVESPGEGSVECLGVDRISESETAVENDSGVFRPEVAAEAEVDNQEVDVVDLGKTRSGRSRRAPKKFSDFVLY